MNSSVPSSTREMPAAGGKRDFTGRRSLELLCATVVEQKPRAERAEHLRHFPPDSDGYRHHFEDAARVRPECRRFAPLQRLGYRWQRAGRPRVVIAVQPCAVPVGDQQEVGIELPPVVLGNRPDRRRILSLDGGLELRKVGDESCEQQEVVRQRAAMLFDEGSRLVQPPLELRFGLPSDAGTHQVHGKADRQDREQRAGQEDAICERGEQHHRTVKSSSIARVSAITATGRCSRTAPSNHAESR